MEIEGGRNNTIVDSTFNCTVNDVSISSPAAYNVFRNNFFLGSNHHIYLSSVLDNVFYNNTFINISSIFSDNWSLSPTNFSYLGLGNKYQVNTSFSGTYCFDDPANLSCDYFPLVLLSDVPEIVSSVSIASLPSFGVGSTLVVLVLLLFVLF
jgi:hypothetical protein